MSSAGFRNIDELSRHMLLFVSALVPKALSSLLTSCCLELAKPHNVSSLFLKQESKMTVSTFYVIGVESSSEHWWFSGRILACHAGGPGSIPGQCIAFYFVCPLCFFQEYL